MCLNRNFTEHKLLKTLRGKGLILKCDQPLEYYIRRIFVEKYAKNMQQKLVLDHYLMLVNRSKYSQCIEEILLEIRYFERKLSKILKKTNFTFVSELSLFLWTLL